MTLEDLPEPTPEGLAGLQRYKDFIAERMRTARESAGLERFDLAEKSGLPLYWIIDVEAARLSATDFALRKVADVLGISIDYFDYGESQQ